MFMVIADGIAWEDSFGVNEWPWEEAVSLAAMLEELGYITDIIQTSRL